MGQRLGHFIKEDAQMAHKHVKSCLAPLIIRDVRIKLQGATTTHPTEWVNYFVLMTLQL